MIFDVVTFVVAFLAALALYPPAIRTLRRLKAGQVRALALSVDAPPLADRPARADPDRVAQVVANLVENALKYAATTVEISTRLVVPPGSTLNAPGVEIGVADDGPGIDPEDLPRVFERLYTSRRQPGRKVGTGLGLAIVRELVAAMPRSISALRTGTGTWHL